MDEVRRAVAFTGYGGPEVLRIMSLPVLAPGPDEVLVRVAAAAVNPTDLVFRAGGHRPAGADVLTVLTGLGSRRAFSRAWLPRFLSAVGGGWG